MSRRYLILLASLVCVLMALSGLNGIRPTAAQDNTPTSTPALGSVTPTASPPYYTSPTPTVTLPPELDKGQLVFRDGADLYLVNTSGKNRRKIGNSRQFIYFCPSYSRDGKHIATIGGSLTFELYTTDGFGNGQRPTVKKGDMRTDFPSGSTTWSPDAKQVAFTGINGGPFYIVGVDGKNLTTINSDGGSFLNLDWSPDGTTFVGLALDKEGKIGIVTVGADGQNLKQLVALPDSDRAITLNTDNYFSRDVVWPHWSPDGKQIAFASSKDGNLTLYIMDADGQNLHRVLKNDTASSYAPSWSPDGQYLVFTSDRDIQRGIYTVKLSGDEIHLVTNVFTGGCSSWQPTPTP
ncbi:MAG: hypothetical protein ABI947_17515 [Chloroflexota bacterium]